MAPQRHWMHTALSRLRTHAVICRVVVVDNKGSTPREEGASMLVGPGFVDGTIGGGSLEYTAIRKAGQLLSSDWSGEAAIIDDLALGPSLGQCCGGATRILFERLDQRQLRVLKAVLTDAENGYSWWLSKIDGPGLTRQPADEAELAQLGDLPTPGNFGFARLVSLDGQDWLLEAIGDFRKPLMLFGAGHVGQALAHALEPLPFNVFWLDARDEQAQNNKDVIQVPDLAQAVNAAPPGCWALVLTHSHALDEEICQAFMEQDDFGYLGMIGSDTKRASFSKRLLRKRITGDIVDKLHCPIGLPGIKGKEPAVIAASVVADLLVRLEQEQTATLNVA